MTGSSSINHLWQHLCENKCLKAASPSPVDVYQRSCERLMHGLWSALQSGLESVTSHTADQSTCDCCHWLHTFVTAVLQGRVLQLRFKDHICLPTSEISELNSAVSAAPAVVSHTSPSFFFFFWNIIRAVCASASVKRARQCLPSQHRCSGESWGVCVRLLLASGGHVSIIKRKQWDSL